MNIFKKKKNNKQKKLLLYYLYILLIIYYEQKFCRIELKINRWITIFKTQIDIHYIYIFFFFDKMLQLKV